MTITTNMKNAFFMFAFFLVSSSLIGQNKLEKAVSYIKDNASSLGVTTEDYSQWVVYDNYVSKHNGVNHIYFQQTVNGIPVEGAIMNVNVLSSGKVLNANSRFIPNASKAARMAQSIDAKQAFSLALASLGHSNVSDSVNLGERKAGNAKKTTFEVPNQGSENVAQLVFLSEGKDAIKLVWKNTITLETPIYEYWNVYVDASTGEIAKTKDLIIRCQFDTPNGECTSHDHDHRGFVSDNFGTADKSNVFVPNSYRVFPLGVESPNHGGRTLVVDPADAVASPHGWHDVNNSPGSEFTNTRGNNVYAYDDISGNNGIGFSPDGGANLEFDFTQNLGLDPATNTAATQNLSSSVTNLFYWNNIMHDVWYRYGFDEVSGNFQSNNYGNGGANADYVLAECQDGGGTNNANFSSPADGSSGRMQMFLWSGGAGSATLNVNSPGSVSGSYPVAAGNFGLASYNITGNLVASNPVDGCAAFSNAGAVNGNIAVVDRGDCQFGDKSLAAQNAGAVAVIICNNEAGGTIAMGPGNVGGQVTIPAVMISQGDCATIRAALGSGVNVTMTGTPGGVSKDGSMDNGIISHEYGHGVSIRLAGGPGNSGCLGNAEQAGEGWSDFFGLVLTQKPGDDKNTVRGIGTYATSEPTTGNGIRAYPYSYDMAVNPFTYADIAGQAVPHGVGSVFCTMIWDLYWDLIDAYGFDSDIYGGSGGNNIAMQLVIDGLKLQPCSPGFVDMRDAILAADEANYNGANRCLIWNTFARRGLGYSADQGSSASNTDQTEAFDLPPDVGNLDITKTSNVSTADEGATVDYTVQITNFCQDATNVQVTDILPAGLSYVAGSASGGGTEAGGIITWPLISNYPKGSATTYTYQAVINPGTYSNTPTTTISDDMESGAGNWTTTNVAGFSNWTLVNDGGSTRWFAEELEAQNLGGTIENQYLTLDAQNLNGNSTLSFLHRYDTEANWDGAKVEISTDGGNRWEDLGPYMTSNGYNDYINNNTADLAFSGNSGGYITTTADLSNFCGANALIRFNFYYDALEAGNGWYVDDVMLSTSTSVVSNIANVSSAAGNSSAFNCVTVTEDTPVIEVNGKTISLSLFPNPVTSTLNLDLESTESLGELTIEIYNTAGQKVRTQKVITANSQQLLPVNVSDFATGIYTVKVIGEAFNLSDKFVVTK